MEKLIFIFFIISLSFSQKLHEMITNLNKPDFILNAGNIKGKLLLKALSYKDNFIFWDINEAKSISLYNLKLKKWYYYSEIGLGPKEFKFIKNIVFNSDTIYAYVDSKKIMKFNMELEFLSEKFLKNRLDYLGAFNGNLIYFANSFENIITINNQKIIEEVNFIYQNKSYNFSFRRAEYFFFLFNAIPIQTSLNNIFVVSEFSSILNINLENMKSNVIDFSDTEELDKIDLVNNVHKGLHKKTTYFPLYIIKYKNEFYLNLIKSSKAKKENNFLLLNLNTKELNELYNINIVNSYNSFLLQDQFNANIYLVTLVNNYEKDLSEFQFYLIK